MALLWRGTVSTGAHFYAGPIHSGSKQNGPRRLFLDEISVGIFQG
jgi:hypothetical protein